MCMCAIPYPSKVVDIERIRDFLRDFEKRKVNPSFICCKSNQLSTGYSLFKKSNTNGVG